VQTYKERDAEQKMATEGERLTRKRTGSRSSDGSHNERLEPQLLRAAESDDVELLSRIVESARAKNQLSENFLRIGLMRSSEKGKTSTRRESRWGARKQTVSVAASCGEEPYCNCPAAPGAWRKS
jgi:hypothetical protein